MMKFGRLVILNILFVFITSNLYAQGHILAIHEGERNFEKIRDAFYKEWEEKGSSFRDLKKFKRWEDMMLPRLRNGNIPGYSYFQEKQKVYQKEQSNTGNQRSKSNPWTTLGPKEWEVGDNGYSPGNGRINCITVDPLDANKIYIGAASGGFWQSKDKGATWVTSTDDLGSLGITDIYINPNNTSEIIILTGDAYGYDTPSIGLFKSTDEGESWTQMGFSLDASEYRTFFKLEVAAQIKNLMLVAGDGIHRSIDNGDTWEQVSTEVVSDLIFHPTNDSIVYACKLSENRNGRFTMLKSTDAGENWVEETFDFSSINKQLARKALAVTADNPDVVYVLSTDESSTFGGLFKSNDQGNTFNLQSNTPNIFGYSKNADDNDGQGWYDLSIAVDPDDEEVLFVSGIHIWKSSNSGKDWELQNFWIWDDNEYPYVHADNHTLDFAHGNLYAGGDGGIFCSPDKGESFQNLSFGLNIGQFYRIGTHPTDEDVIIGGLQDNGSFTRYNGTWYQIFGADGMDALIDHTDPSVVFSEYQFGGIIRYQNHGLQADLYVTNPDDEVGGWITPFLMHPTDNNILYFGYENIWKSTTKGSSMSKISNFQDGNTVDILKIHPQFPENLLTYRGGQFLTTKNDGNTWENISNGLPASMLTDAIYHNNDPNAIYATFSTGEVFYTRDLGINWEQLGDRINTLATNTITQHPCGNVLYVGTDIGVYQYEFSNDLGWQFMSDDLPNVIVRELEIQKSTNTLFAGTYGRGVWKVKIPEASEPTLTQTLSISPVDQLEYLESVEIETTSSADLPVTIESENSEIVRVDGNSIIGVGIGVTSVTLSQLGNCDYLPAEVSFSVEVLKGAQEIIFKILQDDLLDRKGAEFLLEATATSGLPVAFRSSDNNIISINENIATVNNEALGGIVSIIALQEGNEFFAPAEEVAQERTVLILSNEFLSQSPMLLPNPASQFVQLSDQSFINQEYAIFNTSGKLIDKGSISSSTLDIKLLKKGMYFLLINDQSFRLIKD
jgi:photosystem II stability/assembly factor-like uncharacterized protein